ncbi:MAG: regulatory protein GemA [Bauldia sp.]
MNPLAAIHVGRKQLDLEEDDYRALLERVTGKRSSKGMTTAELFAVLDEMRRLGFKPGSKASAGGLDGPYAPKLRALWISGWHLGIVQARDDKALTAFVERQTGLSHTRFLRDAEDASAAIEALKAWLAREGGVDWSIDKNRRPAALNSPKCQVVIAQWRRLIALGAVHVGAGGEDATFAATVSLETGRAGLDDLTDDDWSILMGALGRRVRTAQRRRPKVERAA